MEANKAVDESRIISQASRERRYVRGYKMAAFLLVLAVVYPPTRTAYAFISLVLSQAIGMWLSGYQGLWGCLLNFKWNYDGKGFKTPTPKHATFVNAKRKEWMMMIFTTLVGTMVAVWGLAYSRDHLNSTTIFWTVVYNMFGLGLVYYTSSNAK